MDRKEIRVDMDTRTVPEHQVVLAPLKDNEGGNSDQSYPYPPWAYPQYPPNAWPTGPAVPAWGAPAPPAWARPYPGPPVWPPGPPPRASGPPATPDKTPSPSAPPAQEARKLDPRVESMLQSIPMIMEGLTELHALLAIVNSSQNELKAMVQDIKQPKRGR